MAGRNTKLTAEVIQTVCEAIRKGAFDYVAAQAAGIHKTTFINWMNEGQQPDGDPLKVEFFKQVTEARGAARQDAENRVFAEQPFNWLRFGPGRERPGEPGWTSETTVNVNAGSSNIKLTWGESDEPTTDPDSVATVAPDAAAGEE